ncbi:MAG TPA: DUF3866 family protein, partial [Actinomycetota bacterium]|nr:DUF3866 family protein [Actinomycetota bacterium]
MSWVRLRRGTVLRVLEERRGASELEVEVEGERALAIAYPELVGPVRVGETVVLNTTARTLGLGTGGMDLVVAVEGGQEVDLGDVGRVVKARYTPLQAAVRGVEESHRDT